MYFLDYLQFSVSTHKKTHYHSSAKTSISYYMKKLQLQYISYEVLQKKVYTIIPNK